MKAVSMESPPPPVHGRFMQLCVLDALHFRWLERRKAACNDGVGRRTADGPDAVHIERNLHPKSCLQEQVG